jgi:predicted HTH domain antitoxin
MQTFSIRDLRDRSGELSREAEEGRLSLVTRHGQPLFVTVPFSDEVIASGVHVAMAVSMFKSGDLTLGQAAKLARFDYSDFIEYLGELKIPVLNYDASELDQELAAFERMTPTGDV